MDSTNQEHELRLLHIRVEAIVWILLAPELQAWTVLRGHTRYPSVRLSFPFGRIAISTPVRMRYLREKFTCRAWLVWQTQTLLRQVKKFWKVPADELLCTK